MKRKDEDLITLSLAFVVALILSIPLNFLYLWLWNVVAVSKFGLPTLTFWQMYGISFVLHILLKR